MAVKRDRQTQTDRQTETERVGHFSRWTWVTRMSLFWTLLELRVMEVVVTTGGMTCKAPVKMSPPTNQHPVFYRPDRMPFLSPDQQCQSTDGNHKTRPVMWSETVGLRSRPVQDQKKSVLVLQFWCCVVKHGIVVLVVIMITKDTANFQVLFIVSLFCARNITIVEINSGVHLHKS